MASKKAKTRTARLSKSKAPRLVVDPSNFPRDIDSEVCPEETEDFPGRIVERDGVWGLIQEDGGVLLLGTFADSARYKRKKVDEDLARRASVITPFGEKPPASAHGVKPLDEDCLRKKGR